MLDWKSNIVSPLIVAIFLGGGTILYNKVEEKTTEFQLLVSNHPEVLEDLRNLRNVKDEMKKELRLFKAKTNRRINTLEQVPKANLNPIYNRLNLDSSRINKAFYRLDYLKSLH